MTSQLYDVVVIGGGVAGTALLYSLAKFTDLKRVALVEKYSGVAAVNSKATNNSQTIHCGDIETNYSLEKALKVRRSAQMVVRYGAELSDEMRDRVIYKFPKMVLGVGSQECEFLRQRYEQFKPHFTGMSLLEKSQIAEVEPHVVQVNGQARPEELVAIGIQDEYTAVNYGALSQSFVELAQTVEGKTIDLKLGTLVQAIETAGANYRIVTPNETLTARFVVVSAGGHSLLFAHKMGIGLEYSCLPIAGNFYFTPQVLNGKVYTVQNDKLPFAAIHGDPDVTVPGKTRFGPTALPMPLLERYDWKTAFDYLQVLRLDSTVMAVLWDLFKVRDIRNYIFKNMAFEMPVVDRRLFLQDVRKIVPSLQLEDLEFARGVGGIRPQLIDRTQRKLILGQAEIDPGNGIRFNITPSPGATTCLGNAEHDILRIQEHLGCEFDRSWFEAETVAA
ncbi:FAD-dependent oxidoreductase [Leptolyngbya sp. FACHB-711]|uniref:FAD-dependent oxidoreductase n=1 Tax=unclassified Leptolyngbya TaxID=2650499 RepID=UPI00168922A4|nr:FAD-dependent oxidoreductase [Leptolyngbya sp. FACHB-711]MBD1850710.1 FAD-dependent oxidoreductase [Cyanobacteria bacterium FACHB-502]MBD2026793.1 FAD-dependent oxidoreductase [Leptolyngbya sp. FACHB-711]